MYLDKEGSWINTATEPKAKKAIQSSKSNFIKVIEYCMTLLSVEENEIRRTKQPKDRAERAMWAEKLMTLSREVHLKLMSHLLIKESDMRAKHKIAQLSKTVKKKALLSTVKNLARRICDLKTMEMKKLGEYKTGKNMVRLDANDDLSDDDGGII
jgi:hypothetical protein